MRVVVGSYYHVGRVYPRERLRMPPPRSRLPEQTALAALLAVATAGGFEVEATSLVAAACEGTASVLGACGGLATLSAATVGTPQVTRSVRGTALLASALGGTGG